MLEDGKISNKQAVFLIINTILATSIIFLPSAIYKEARQDAWISIIPVTAFGVVAGLIIASLGIRFPRRTIIQYSGDIVGKPLGKVIGLIYTLFFIYINTFIIREIADMFNTNFMPETPISVFSIGIVFAAAYAIRSGLEVLARMGEIISPFVLVMLLLIVALIYPEIDTKLFFPVLEKGFIPVLKGAYPPALFFSETIIMVMLIPYLNKPSGAKASIAKAILIIGLFQLMIMATVTGVLGGLTADMNFPTLMLARYISLADLIERVEPLIMLTWIAGGFIKISVFYYCAVLAAAQWLNLREYKALVLPIGVLLTTLSIILWENIAQLSEQIFKRVPPYFLTIEVGIPLILLVLAILRGKGAAQR
ncbi:GerAB/ArcD/ProY family transporter [Desulfoscipio geothermicus]|uniref:Spore germination protein KB n=1 Tax=Desulfoscipio geothermicus DSM 3669 TaxID=1121426 RepID=A0A1I6DWW6_9FIRM|nr:endospore germination permease [Desulfoscipio geothermicus]SFR09778.1 spore germination protein KB [Desulfoscipio geothermicus DSM 3669]